MTAIAVTDLTQATLEGTGIFDVLMRANKAHLEAEFAKNRIRGAEYSTVYLGSLTQVMQTALQFLLSKEKTNLEAQLLQKQIDLAEVEVQKATASLAQIEAQTLLINQQKANLVAEASNIPKQGLLLDVQKAQTEAQTLLVTQQKTNLVAEGLNIPKQGDLIDANKAQVAQQTTNLVAQKLQVESQTQLVDQQKTNLIAEGQNIPKQGLLIDANKAQVTQQTENLIAQKLQVEAQTLLVGQQKANAIIEGTVLVAQECKLRAEYDLTLGSTLKVAQETALLTQKVATERAQITAMGVDADSVVGRQKALYLAQSTGFTRDAEQKAADLLIKSWMAQATTNDLITANSTNKLADLYVGKAVDKLLAGVGAV